MPTDPRPGSDFIVKRDDLRMTRVVAAPVPQELAPGEVLFRVERFALTANNVTYGVIGDMLGYWGFFPAAEEGWGRIPVWGFAVALRSRHPDVPEGERVFGYLPMSTHLRLQAGQVTPDGIVDVAPHRREYAAIYNRYARVAADPQHDPRHDDQQALLRPLFTTAFLLDDFLAEHELFGAKVVVLASASSKTAIGLAHLLSLHGRGRVVGLTSPRHLDFITRLGCYDRVLAYDAIETLAVDEPIVFVDMAGNADVVRRIHEHLREGVKHSAIVGVTHWERRGGPAALPGAEPTLFFAPTQFAKRAEELGVRGLQDRLGESWRGFVAFTDTWLKVIRGEGAADVERAYRDVLEGRAQPHQGHVLAL